LLKAFFLIAAIVVGVSVLLQHVHYTIDVFVAPFFAYCSFYIVKKIKNNSL
jgi:membrane-associated phospholipid phosphatase